MRRIRSFVFSERINSLTMKSSKHLLVVILLVTLANCLTAGNPAFKSEQSKNIHPWTHLTFRNDPLNFQFAIVSDRHAACRPGIFEDAVKKLNLLQPEFVICVGDLIKGYTNDTAVVSNQWNDFDGLAKRLQMPFFYVAGNHDITNTNMLEVWRSRFGTPYYYFIYCNVLFLCLDTEDPQHGHISSEQIEYFRNILKWNQRVRWTIIFMHDPLWVEPDDGGFRKIEELLADRPYTVFAGHFHKYRKFVRNGRCYYHLATTGGLIPSSSDGRCFDEIVWVTMTENGPVPVNLMLKGILPDDFMDSAE